MLDTGISLCEAHLESNKEKLYLEFDTRQKNGFTDQITSDQIPKILLTDSSKPWPKKLTDTIGIQFHVFIPSELKKTFEKPDFGIVGTFNDWNPEKLIVLSRDKNFLNNGWLVTSRVMVPSNLKNFEYKYILKDKTTGQCVWELLPNEVDGNREFNLPEVWETTKVVEKYDGIMLPHENNKQIFDKYYEETIRLMLSELLNKVDTLEATKGCLKDLNKDLNKIYKTDEDHFNNVLYRILVELLKKESNKQLSFLWTTAVLANRNDDSSRKWNIQQENHNSILQFLNLI